MTTPIVRPSTSSTTPTSITLDGSVVVNILGQNYTLEGTLGGGLNVEYHKDFQDAINLGPVTVIADQIATAFGYNGIKDDINTALTSLKGLPVIGPEITGLLQNTGVRITDLVINTPASTFEIGFALDFSLSPLTVFGIELIAIGLKVTSSPNATTTSGTGTSTGTGTTTP